MVLCANPACLTIFVHGCGVNRVGCDTLLWSTTARSSVSIARASLLCPYACLPSYSRVNISHRSRWGRVGLMQRWRSAMERSRAAWEAAGASTETARPISGSRFSKKESAGAALAAKSIAHSPNPVTRPSRAWTGEPRWNPKANVHAVWSHALHLEWDETCRLPLVLPHPPAPEAMPTRSYWHSEVTSPAVRSVASGTRNDHLSVWNLKRAASCGLLSSLRSVGSTVLHVQVITSEVRATLNYNSATRLQALTEHRRHGPGHLTCTNSRWRAAAIRTGCA